jgi:hypothetical protein
MQSVVMTQTFLRQARREGISDEDLEDIAVRIASAPTDGDMIPGTGGARKMRHARHGQGKSGGFRTIHYFGGDDVPVFVLAIYSKNTKANLTKAERNGLAKLLPLIAEAYRQRKETRH